MIEYFFAHRNSEIAETHKHRGSERETKRASEKNEERKKERPSERHFAGDAHVKNLNTIQFSHFYMISELNEAKL